MSRATRMRKMAAQAEPEPLPIAPEAVAVAAQECAKPVRGGYPCPSCSAPTRVLRTTRRAVGLARERLCPKCGHTLQTREAEEISAVMRKSVDSLMRSTFPPIPPSELLGSIQTEEPK